MNLQLPIPYSGYHVGPRRTLTVNLRCVSSSPEVVHVTIDGSTYVLPWGVVNFDVPADRPVSVIVYQMTRHAGSESVSGLARTVLAPGLPTELEYRTTGGFFGFRGEIGLPGVTRGRDRRAVDRTVLLVATYLALMIMLVALAILIAVP